MHCDVGLGQFETAVKRIASEQGRDLEVQHVERGHRVAELCVCVCVCRRLFSTVKPSVHINTDR